MGPEHASAGDDHDAITLRHATTRWVSGVLMGFLFFLISLALAPLPPFQVLDRIGSDLLIDFASRRADSYVRFAEGGPDRIVFVSVDDDSLRQWGAANGREARGRIARLLHALRQTKARAILFDIIFTGNTPADAGLRQVLSEDGVPVALAAPDAATVGRGWKATMRLELGEPYRTVQEGGPHGKVHFASSQVTQQSDFVVRSLRQENCVQIDDRWHSLPSLARTTAALARGKMPEPANQDCPDDSRIRNEPISFLIRPDRGVATAPVVAHPWFRTVSAADVLRAPAAIDWSNAVIVVGQDNATSTEDRFETPLGEMPGALLQANALAGLLQAQHPTEVDHLAHYLLELRLLLVTAGTGVAYWLVSRLARRLVARRTPAGWAGSDPHRNFAAFLLELLVFVMMTAVAIVVVEFVALRSGLAAIARGESGWAA
ncbi:CHASE2 domain-containing protein [Dankookia sp. P2]|uniref:CHASE2 domain-containing protein n=1 Tax=Dankookia sp. P2 TaxID=3423955 RepID=UPI003D66C1FD